MTPLDAGAWRGLPPGPRALAVGLLATMALAMVLAGLALAGNMGSGGDLGIGTVATVPDAGETSLAAIAERPLFSRSRRPEAPAPAAMPLPPPPPPPRDRRIVLRGVYIDGAEAKAFVTSPDQPEGAWVARGGSVAGWQVAAVSAEQVRLEADGESFSAPLSPVAGLP